MRPGFDPWVRKIPWRREGQPTPVFLPGDFHGQRILVGYSPRDHKESGRIVRLTFHFHGLPGSSAGKDSVCSEGELSLIPGPGRSPREGIGYLLQYSWTSLVPHTVKKESTCSAGDWIWSLGWEDPLEEGMATHSSIFAWRIPMDREVPGGLQSMGLQRIGHD